MQFQNWMIYAIDIAIAAGAFTTWVWFMRRKYANMISPSKKHPYGQVVAEFWPESGRREYQLLPIEANGLEVRAPTAHKCPRYFFNKQATFTTKYPMDMFFRSLGISVDAPIISWPLNNPEPISPYNYGSPVASSTLLGALQDDDFLTFMMAASKEIDELQKELAKALTAAVPKAVFYIMVGAAILAAGAAAAFGYMVYMGLINSGWL
jgi:hypothetical protein